MQADSGFPNGNLFSTLRMSYLECVIRRKKATSHLTRTFDPVTLRPTLRYRVSTGMKAEDTRR